MDLNATVILMMGSFCLGAGIMMKAVDVLNNHKTKEAPAVIIGAITLISIGFVLKYGVVSP